MPLNLYKDGPGHPKGTMVGSDSVYMIDLNYDFTGLSHTPTCLVSNESGPGFPDLGGCVLHRPSP